MCISTEISYLVIMSTWSWAQWKLLHYNDVIMGTVVFQITSLTIVYSSFIQAQIKENIKAPRHWLLCGEFTRTGEFPAQMASNMENVSIWWRHHVCDWNPAPSIRRQTLVLIQESVTIGRLIQGWLIIGLILGLRPANERWLCFATTSHIGLVQALNAEWK